MLHIYKMQAKFILDPNLNRTLPSLYICSVRMQGDQVASEKVLPPFAYIAGLSVTLDTGITRPIMPLRGIQLQSTRRGYCTPISLPLVN